MPSVAIVGGGLAGLAAAAALATTDFEVHVFEARGFLGGRAASYLLSGEETSETIDNCQHVLLRCCLNLLDFYKRLEVDTAIRFYREFFFIEPGGRTSVLCAGRFPPPLHFFESFLRLRFLNTREKIAIARALRSLAREYQRADLDGISMLDWLREKHQPPRAIQRFWNQVLVSAVNEELDKIAARHAFQVFRLGFLARADSYEMGVPRIPLGQLYGSTAWRRLGKVHFHLRSSINNFRFENGGVERVQAPDINHSADYYIAAVPFEKLPTLAPELGLNLSEFTHSPITGVHLWFDRPVTNLPHATLLDRTIQWMFNKDSGRYIQLVISASRMLVKMPRQEVITLALRELAEFFPEAREAHLEKAHVVKEIRATFSAKPGLEGQRPKSTTAVPNLFLAGDWTRSGWPATMEGAVRSGYLAAEAVTRAAGIPRKFVVPDIA